MGTPQEPPRVKPIVGVLAASPNLLCEAGAALAALLSSVDLASEPVEWGPSVYYRDEMGDRIWRQFLALDGLLPPDELARVKRQTNELETRWRSARGRQVNLDPGYLDLIKVVLASTKDAAHRVYVGQGIYAEATLWYVSGSFLPWPNTYPDYASPAAIDFFNRVRRRYRTQCRSSTGRPSRSDPRGG